MFCGKGRHLQGTKTGAEFCLELDAVYFGHMRRRLVQTSDCQGRGRPSGSLHRGCPCHSAPRRLIPLPRRTGPSCWRRLLRFRELFSLKSGRAQSSATGRLRESPLGRPQPWAKFRRPNSNMRTRPPKRMPRLGPPDLRLSPYSERSPRLIADCFYEVPAQGTAQDSPKKRPAKKSELSGPSVGATARRCLGAANAANRSSGTWWGWNGGTAESIVSCCCALLAQAMVRQAACDAEAEDAKAGEHHSHGSLTWP